MIVLSAIMTACYEDKGNYDYIDLPEIKIEAKDTLYVMQFTTLELPVDIELQGMLRKVITTSPGAYGQMMLLVSTIRKKTSA